MRRLRRRGPQPGEPALSGAAPRPPVRPAAFCCRAHAHGLAYHLPRMSHRYHLADAIDLSTVILDVAEDELRTSPEAQAIIAAGRGPELRRLAAALAARAALAVRASVGASSL